MENMMYDKLSTCFFIIINIVIFSNVPYLLAAVERQELINNEIYNIPEVFTEGATSSNILHAIASATKTSTTQTLEKETAQPNAEISYADIPPITSENMPPAYTEIEQNYPSQANYVYLYPPTERVNYVINPPNNRNILVTRQRNNNLCYVGITLVVCGGVIFFVLLIAFYIKNYEDNQHIYNTTDPTIWIER